VPYVIGLDGRNAALPEVVGGKAAGLASLARHRIRVPRSFALTTHAYREFVADAGLLPAIRESLSGAETFAEQARASARIRLLFEAQTLDGPLRDELARAYAELGGEEPLAVAVRSSAVSEDGADTSLAGACESYLWIRGADALHRAVLGCWASLFAAPALSHLRRAGVRADETAMGVVVQAMVPAAATGVMFTIDPVTGDRSQIAIEAGTGVASVVGGEVTPDRFCIDKVTLEIRSRAPAGEHGICVSDAEAIALAGVGKRIEHAFGVPQDVEWAIASQMREIVVLQARPETVWSRRPRTAMA
jgi:phosphoenolpyruvate synthase/pyruvate phosphate dikinase